jgi:AcrR family transcriptional regulator
MSKTLERRAKQREALIEAAERAITSKGLAGVRSRELAGEIGIANGAVYNLVDDIDALILSVGSRTLARLDAALTEAESSGSPQPIERLVRTAIAYCDFAASNFELWRALFEHRMAPDKPLPDWAISDQMSLFRHIHGPLTELFPAQSPAQLSLTARSLFSAVHGMVSLGLEQKLIAVPLDALRAEIATVVRATVSGLVAQSAQASTMM